jgi:amino-acid N-acetyltransferase
MSGAPSGFGPPSVAAVALGPALAADFDAVVALLSVALLPVVGVEDQFPDAFAVARTGAEVVGVAGLEVYADAGLLRSVAVHPGWRGRGVGHGLVEERLQAARARGLSSVYLLTTTASAFFRRLGFVDADRARVPAPLKVSPEFAFACPASASCLVRCWAERAQ